MRKIFSLLTITTLLSAFAQAQTNTGKIRGNVVDGSQKTIISATISLLKAADSSVVKFSVADKSGRYEFDNISAGKYLVSVSAVGHNKGFSEVVDLNSEQSTVVLKVIELVPQAKDLTGVTVTARKPFIEQKIDRTVVNVEASVTNVGATALEVLEKSPGVTVDKDGNISLKGKQGVLVMMDGRPTYLSATELSNYLKSLPASAIEQIEIMTNPSAKYDAAGNSGIINIKSKKNKQKGFNGNLTANYGQGKFWKSNNSINVNYRTGKVNLFANASASQWNGFNTLDIHRKFKDPDTKEVTAIFEQTSHMRFGNKNANVKLGADFYLNQKTTLGIVTTGFINPEKFNSKNTSFLQNANNQLDSIVFAESKQNATWKNGSVNLNLRHQFDSTGRELTSDVDYITYRAINNQNFSNITYNPTWIKRRAEDLRGHLPVHIDIYTAKVDYVHPLKKEAKLETGLKTSFVKTDNSANYFTVWDHTEVPDYKKTNRFLYKENINAAYINFNKQFKKFGVQAGLRYEHISYKGNQLGNPEKQDSSFKSSYGRLFPTMFVSYAANKNNQFRISYGRRIDRPAYQDLNPFLFFLDNYTYNSGNPYLRPQFTNNIELSHTFKSFLTTTLNYSRTKDLIAETFEQGQDLSGSTEYATIVKRGNIGRRDAAGISVSAQVPVTKWWSSMIYTNYNFNKYKGTLNGNKEIIDIEATNLTLNVNNQFKFNKGWSAEVSGFYRTKGVEGQILIQPMGQLSAGISKQVLNGKGSVKLNVRDIFYTQVARGDINLQNTEAHFESRRDSRVANISFTYRFGKPMKEQQPRRKTGGADAEQNRVRVGSGS
jgi:hypothetical protein